MATLAAGRCRSLGHPGADGSVTGVIERVDRLDPSALRWLIGYELRAAREQAGHTQSAAARVLACTHAKINYLEQGKNRSEEHTSESSHSGESRMPSSA